MCGNKFILFIYSKLYIKWWYIIENNYFLLVIFESVTLKRPCCDSANCTPVAEEILDHLLLIVATNQPLS